MGFLRGLLGIALVFGVINLILWGAQSLYYREDIQRIKVLEAHLTTEEASMAGLKSQIQTRERVLAGMLNQLDLYKRSGDTRRYNASVDEYNRLVGIYKTEAASYNTRVALFNKKVEELNALIENSGTRWYVIPIPLGGLSGKGWSPIR